MPTNTKKYSLTFLFTSLFIAIMVFNVVLLYWSQEEKMAWLHFTTTAASLVFFLVALLIFLRLVSSPLNKLTNACEEVKKGNLNVQLSTKSKNEIGGLIATFNQMIKNLKESQAALKEARDILEIKVQARTKELEEMVDNQEKIIEERTRELKDRIKKLERFRRLTVGRELKMIHLKEEVKKLKDISSKEFRPR